MGISAQGCIVYFSTTTGVSSASAQVGEVKSFDFNEPARTMIDDSNLGSTMETVKPGILKRAQLTIDYNWVSTSSGQIALTTAVKSTVLQSLMIEFPTTIRDVVKFDGYVSDIKFSGGFNDIMRRSVTFDINAIPTWTTLATS